MTLKQSDHTQIPPGDSWSLPTEASQRRAVLHQASDLVCLRFGITGWREEGGQASGRGKIQGGHKGTNGQQPIEASKQGVQETTKSSVA